MQQDFQRFRPNIFALCLLSGLLTSCTTLATGLAEGPPGINSHSFRECLIDNGFFSGPKLVGISGQNAAIRKELRRSTHPSNQLAYMDLSAPQFTALVAQTIRNGLFRHEQYGDADGVAAQMDAPFGHPVSDPVYNRPYVNNLLNDESAPDRRPQRQARNSTLPAPKTPATGSASARGDIAVNRYLDCYVGPVGLDEPRPSTTGDYDVEGRLLRAHVLLSMLAAYGAELVTSTPSKKQAEQATRLLGHLRDAELSLRSASMVMNLPLREYLVLHGGGGFRTQAGPTPAANLPELAATKPVPTPRPAGKVKALKAPEAITAAAKTPGATPALDLADAANRKTVDDAGQLVAPADRAGSVPMLRWYGYTTRLLRVFQIGVDIEVIDAQQSLNRLTNILSAFAAPTPAAFSLILKDAITGLGTVQKVQLYGTAMRLDGSETLAEHRLSLVGYHGEEAGVRGPSVDVKPLRNDIETWRYDIASERQRWRRWDVRLDASCRLLANVAKQTDAGCVPNAEALKAAVAAEIPQDDPVAP